MPLRIPIHFVFRESKPPGPKAPELTVTIIGWILVNKNKSGEFISCHPPPKKKKIVLLSENSRFFEDMLLQIPFEIFGVPPFF